MPGSIPNVHEHLPHRTDTSIITAFFFFAGTSIITAFLTSIITAFLSLFASFSILQIYSTGYTYAPNTILHSTWLLSRSCHASEYKIQLRYQMFQKPTSPASNAARTELNFSANTWDTCRKKMASTCLVPIHKILIVADSLFVISKEEPAWKFLWFSHQSPHLLFKLHPEKR
jgi:hypothetical protein